MATLRQVAVDREGLGLCHGLTTLDEGQAAGTQGIAHGRAATAVLVGDLAASQVGLGQDLAHADVLVDTTFLTRVPVLRPGGEDPGLAAEHQGLGPGVHHAGGILEHDALLGLGIAFLEGEDIQEEHVVLPDQPRRGLALVRVLDVDGADAYLDAAGDHQGIVALGTAQMDTDATRATSQANVMVLTDG